MTLTAAADVSLDLHVLGTEPAHEYHAKAGEYLSSHQLIDFLNCPWLYRKKQLGLIPDEDSNALLVGRATHTRILEGRDAYEAQYALGGPINKTTSKPFGKDTKAFKEWADAQGKPGIHYEDLDLIEHMAAGVAKNDAAVELLLYGRCEGVVRTDYCDTPCQIRIDWLHPHRGVVDLKTTADLTWFEHEARRRRYHNQAAFYQAVLAEALAVDPRCIPVHIVAIEKVEPYRCGVWQVSEHTLAAARRENRLAIDRLRRAWETDDFPTGYEAIRTLEVT